MTNNLLRKLVQCLCIPCLLFMFTQCSSDKKKQKTILTADNIPQFDLPAPGPVSAQETKQVQQDCRLWFDTILGKIPFNGSVLVAKNGQILYEKYQGTAHLGGKDTINADTRFHIASVTKTFTAMAVLKLWQEKKLKLDDELSVYFPEFNYPGVTIRSLLNHRSGLPNYLYFMDELGWNKTIIISNQDVLNYLVNRKAEIKNIAPANKHFSYCNTNYALLALLIEKVSGMSYPNYLQTYFFRPLNMTNSFVYTQLDSSKTTPSYDWRGQLIPNNHLDGVYGDKNIYSTAHDLLQWDRLLRTNLLFNAETLEQAYTPYSNEKPGIRNYGLGWRMNIYPDGNKIIFHNGWWHGNNAAFIRMINQDVTIIALGNRFNRGIYKAKYLVNSFGPDYYTAEEEESDTVKSSDTTGKNNQQKVKPAGRYPKKR
jgi:CubicO group peptidase (beta-lactamase class C family)